MLYRAHTHSMELQMELARRGIPFVVRSGVRFFEQAHIKDVLAHLRFVQNPQDELSFKRIVKLVPGIGAAGADALWTQVEECALQGRDPRAQVESFAAAVPPKARTGLRALGAALRSLVSLRSQPSEMIRCVLHEGGYAEALKIRYANAQARQDDVLQLSDYALQAGSLEELLAELTLLDSLEAEDVVEGGDPDEKLSLSSVHQAKGLEWRAVFLIWLADGRFPSAPALRAADGEEEERRLFYVAVTRARDELYLTYPMMQEDRDRARLMLRPSRFLDELPTAPTPPYEKWSIELTAERAALGGLSNRHRRRCDTTLVGELGRFLASGTRRAVGSGSSMPADKPILLGIDLGTTNTCVAYVRNKVPEIVPTRPRQPHPALAWWRCARRATCWSAAWPRTRWSSTRATPSTAPSGSSAASTTRKVVQDLKHYFSYEIVEGTERRGGGDAGRQGLLAAADQRASCCSTARRMAERYAGQEIDEAVISVPAYYNDNQRNAVKEAGELAGFDVQAHRQRAHRGGAGVRLQPRLRPEGPGLRPGRRHLRRLRAAAHGNVFEVLATGGDTFLGGVDFDNRIIDFVLEEFRKETKIDLTAEPHRHAADQERRRGGEDRPLAHSATW